MSLEEQIINKRAVVGIVGLGYVGLPLAVEFCKAGFRVMGVDYDKTKVNMINRGQSYIVDVDAQTLREQVKHRKFTASDDYSYIAKCDIVNICVPTPFNKNKEPDISYIIDASEKITEYLHKGMLIILKSTTFPETTEKIVLPILQKSKLRVGQDFYLAFSPERIDPGNKKYTVKNTPVVVGGVTKKCTELACLFYKQMIEKVIAVSSPRVAELTKLLENIFRSVNIALVNEMACLCERMGGIDIWEVVKAASTKPFGFMPFYPGPGLGGHCIPVDPYYLAWKAREYDFHTDFIELAAKTNESMPYFVVNKVIEALSQKGIPASKAKVLVLGVAFKKDINDTRSSPALKVMEILKDKVAKLFYNDPYVPEVKVNGEKYRSLALEEKVVREVDCVIITTNHSAYEYEKLVQWANLIVDTRNATGTFSKRIKKIIRLGYVK
ncbi:MAG: nucleotide sugar dehydrogenase [Candidatus Edwardsbacteria bacterium]